MLKVLLFSALCALIHVAAISNGKGITPPMGWRSWNLFGANVNQELIQKQMDAITSRNRLVDGVPTSLQDLGYSDVGLDDAWQLCGSYGSNSYTYHDENGVPAIDYAKFPNFSELTKHAHGLGLTAGWYGNNCICQDHCDSDACYEQDVKALVGLGFDSVKLDGCGKQLDLQKWSDLIEQTGKSILIENCHWGQTLPNATWCPWNYYRSSGDIRANYESVLKNLMTVVPLANKGLSTPGCWAYPDMLEVGCADGPGGTTDKGLSFIEARTHFGAWSIVSSPLILSHDMTNDTITDAIWPIISNREVISVNQAWAGESGNLFAHSKVSITIKSSVPEKQNPLLNTQEVPQEASVHVWQQWSKKVNASTLATAVLLMNNGFNNEDITLSFDEVPSFKGLPSSQKYSVRCLYGHKDLGDFSGSYGVTLEKHDSRLILVTPLH